MTTAKQGGLDALHPGVTSTTGLEPVERSQLGRNLTYGMVDMLGSAVVAGRYEDAPFPVEAELAKQYFVSRSVTREAVKMLTAKGLLSARPRQGTIAEPMASWNLFDTDVLRWLLDRRPSVELLRHFNQLRVTIEPEAAALAARFAGEDDLRRIDLGLERMRLAEREGGDALEADIAFHVAVLRASRNPFYAQFRDVVATALRSSIRFTNRINGHNGSVAAHAAVRDAIRAGKANRARLAMHAIIAEVLSLIDDLHPVAADTGNSLV